MTTCDRRIRQSICPCLTRESTSPSNASTAIVICEQLARENKHSLGFPEADGSVVTVETNEGNLFKKTPAGTGCKSLTGGPLGSRRPSNYENHLHRRAGGWCRLGWFAYGCCCQASRSGHHHLVAGAAQAFSL